jgi:hypothetical protein
MASGLSSFWRAKKKKDSERKPAQVVEGSHPLSDEFNRKLKENYAKNVKAELDKPKAYDADDGINFGSSDDAL